jgi:hypothetical protein
MFTSTSLSRKRQAAKIVFSLFFALCLAALSFLVLGCPMDAESGSGALTEDHSLNQRLVGAWYRDFGGGYTDSYTITAGSKITHPSDFGNGLTNADIAYVYNFSNTAGCLIIKRDTDGKFTAVYYKELKTDSIIIGDAFNPDYTYPTADSLEAAKTTFAPENRTKYGGDLTNASPIDRVK